MKKSLRIENFFSIIAVASMLFINMNTLVTATRWKSAQYALFSGVLFLLIGFFALATKRIRIQSKTFIGFSFLVAIILFSCLINADFYIVNFVVLFELAKALLIVSIVKFDSFLRVYVKLMTVLAAVSLILQISVLLFPNITSIARECSNANGVLFYDFGLYFKSENESFRNYGIFTEPGDYQHYLNIAILFLLFFPNIFRSNKMKFTASMILSVAVLTTFSPAGILFLALLWAAFFLENVRNTKILFGGLALLVLLFIVANVFVSNVFEYVFYKFGSKNGNSSLEYRVLSFVIGIRSTMQNPLFGSGFSRATSYMENEMVSLGLVYNQTNTITSYSAFYGIPFAFALLVPYLYVHISCGKKHRLLVSLLLLVGVIVSISNERFFCELTFSTFALYGVDEVLNRKKYEKQRLINHLVFD